MIPIATTSRICEHLEKYVYDRIWNEPYTESRMYTVPGIISPVDKHVVTVDGEPTTVVQYTPASGYLSGRYSKILLPPFNSEEDLKAWLPSSATKFFVYAIPDRFFSAAKVGVPRWTLLSDYCTDRCLDLHVFTESGVILNRGAIYIKQADMNDCILMAVDANMFLQAAGSWDEAGSIRFGKYIDSDGTADNKVYAYQVTNTQFKVRSTTKPNYPWEGKSYLLYNGKLVTDELKYRPYIKEGAWVEAVTDEDIVGVFEVPVTGDSVPSYTSDDGGEWLIVHIPKEINHDNFLITPNTCDMWLCATSTTKGNIFTSGVYIYQCGREQYYRQLTHNDFAIDLAALRRVADANEFGGCYLKVYVRTHNKKSVVVRDANYVDMLYNLSDEEILLFLRDIHPWQLPKPDTSCTWNPEQEVYWYEDAESETGWNHVEGIDSQEKFDAALVEHPNLYATPADTLHFWSANLLEDSLYANALIRRRSGKYQDPLTQCAICGNSTCPIKADIAEAITDKVCPKFIKTPMNQCDICGHADRCPVKEKQDRTRVNIGYNCPHYSVRSMADYVHILGYFHVLSLVGKRIWHLIVSKTGTHEYIVQAPLALSPPEMEAQDFFCLVYHNGYRIDQSRISISKTNRDNYGARELTHTTSTLSRSTLVIQSAYASRLKVTIAPLYADTTDDTVLKDKAYYKDKEDAKVLAKVVSRDEYEIMDEDERASVDYVIGDLINKDKGNPWVQVPEGTLYSPFVTYYDAAYNRLVPGEEGDYVIGDVVEGTVYTHSPALFEIVPEFEMGDAVTVEVYDNRTEKTLADGTSDGFRPIRWIKREDAISAYRVKVATTDQWKLYTYDSVTKPTAHGNETVYQFTELKLPDGSLDDSTMLLTIPPSIGTMDLTGKYIYLVEGPNTLVTPVTTDLEALNFDFIGHNSSSTNLITDTAPGEVEGSSDRQVLAIPKESTVVFVNNKRLIEGLDYSVVDLREMWDSENKLMKLNHFYPIIQNVSYLWDGTHETKTGTRPPLPACQYADVSIDFFRTDTTLLGTQRGFLVGRTVTWTGQAPFWFNELSTLTIDGAVCSNFTHTMGSVTVTDNEHRNGSPYEIRTACSKRVIDIVGCEEEKDEDVKKILIIRDFFEAAPVVPIMQTIIPHSHRIYSIYLNKIIHDYQTGSFDFFMVGQTTTKKVGSVVSGTLITEENFADQFTGYAASKKYDIAYQLSPFDLGFVDVDPLYIRSTVGHRDDYVKLMKLIAALSPTDNVQHKDAINGHLHSK